MSAARFRLTSQSVGAGGPMSTPREPSRGGTTHSCYGEVDFAADSAPIVVLDENDLAEGADYFAPGLVEPSPDGSLIAYSVDLAGDEVFTLHFRDVGSGVRPARDGRAHLLRRGLVGRRLDVLLHGPRRRLPAVPGVAARARDAGRGRRPGPPGGRRAVRAHGRGLPFRAYVVIPRRAGTRARSGWCRRPSPRPTPSWSSRGARAWSTPSRTRLARTGTGCSS